VDSFTGISMQNFPLLKIIFHNNNGTNIGVYILPLCFTVFFVKGDNNDYSHIKRKNSLSASAVEEL